MSGCKTYSRKDCCQSHSDKQFSTLDAIVRSYEKKDHDNLIRDRMYYSQNMNKDIKQCIINAAKSEDENGKISLHQRRIGRQRLLDAGEIISDHHEQLRENVLIGFDKVYETVEGIIRTQNGLGDLFCYDFSVRFCAAFGVVPTKVYLHAGTLAGAKKLQKRGLLTVSGTLGKTLPLDCFPLSLQHLSADHVENLLCLYKEHFDTITI